MSVLACDRRGCSNIMCSRLILEGTRYICTTCFEELLICRRAWPNGMALAEVKSKIVDFMETPVGTFIRVDEPAIEEEFQRLVAWGGRERSG